MTRERLKSCDRCTQISTPLFRCQWDASKEWQLICQACCDRVSLDNPLYRYGGAWKAKKRH